MVEMLHSFGFVLSCVHNCCVHTYRMSHTPCEHHSQQDSVLITFLQFMPRVNTTPQSPRGCCKANWRVVSGIGYRAPVLYGASTEMKEIDAIDCLWKATRHCFAFVQRISTAIHHSNNKAQTFQKQRFTVVDSITHTPLNNFLVCSP